MVHTTYTFLIYHSTKSIAWSIPSHVFIINYVILELHALYIVWNIHIYINVCMMLKMMKHKKICGMIHIHWINPMDDDVFCKIKCLGNSISSKGH
jgi:hypothetical protein